MNRINDYRSVEGIYQIYLTENTTYKANALELHSGIFTGAIARLVNRNIKKYSTYYFAEQNLLFYIEFKAPNNFYFLDIKRLNIFGSQMITKFENSINDVKCPVFFKSYEDGRKVYLNENLPIKMKKNQIPPHHISLKEIVVPKGNHSLYENGLIIDFKFTDEGKYFITDIIKPDILNFGLAVVKN